MGHFGQRVAAALLAASLFIGHLGQAQAADILQCVPYARAVSGVNIRGDAWTWWDKAAGLYDRGHRPRKGAVLAFQPNGPMQLGHVAVVSRVLSDREVLIRHANWSTPGAIEEDVRAVDVSEEGDWSAVRVWYSPSNQMGARINPTFGFIYSKKGKLMPFGDSSDEVRSDHALYTQSSGRAVPKLPVVADGGDDSIIAPAHTDPGFIVEYADGADDAPVRPAARASVRLAAKAPGKRDRTLGDIIADVKRQANIR